MRVHFILVIIAFAQSAFAHCPPELFAKLVEPNKIPQTKSIEIMQNDGGICHPGLITYSDGFGSCHAILITNLETGKTMLVHSDPSTGGTTLLKMKPYIRGDKQFFSEGLGEGPLKATFITGQASTKGDEEILKSWGIEIGEKVNVPVQGREHWKIAIAPEVGTVIASVDNSKFIQFKLPKIPSQNTLPAEYYFVKFRPELTNKIRSSIKLYEGFTKKANNSDKIDNKFIGDLALRVHRYELAEKVLGKVCRAFDYLKNGNEELANEQLDSTEVNELLSIRYKSRSTYTNISPYAKLRLVEDLLENIIDGGTL